MGTVYCTLSLIQFPTHKILGRPARVLLWLTLSNLAAGIPSKKKGRRQAQGSPLPSAAWLWGLPCSIPILEAVFTFYWQQYPFSNLTEETMGRLHIPVNRQITTFKTSSSRFTHCAAQASPGLGQPYPRRITQSFFYLNPLLRGKL